MRVQSDEHELQGRDLWRAGALDLYISRGAVHVNGMTLIPGSGASVVVFPALQRVVSSNATVALGIIPITSGPVDFDLKNTVKTLLGSTIGASAPLLTVDPGRFLPSVGGFTVAGQIQLSLFRRGATRSTRASMRLTLPPLFDAFGGQPPSGGVVALADNTTNGLVLDHLDLSLPEADIGPLSFRQMSFVYSAHGNVDPQCGRDWWKANGEISLGIGSNPTLSLLPPPSQNGIAFCAGSFRGAGASLSFRNPLDAPEVLPGVTLRAVSEFALATHPTLIRGGVQLGVLGFGDVHGTVMVGFPSNNETYTLSPADASNPGGPGKAGDLAPLAGRKITTPFVAAGGSVSVDLPEPIGPSRLGSGYFFVSGDELALGGNAGHGPRDERARQLQRRLGAAYPQVPDHGTGRGVRSGLRAHPAPQRHRVLRWRRVGRQQRHRRVLRRHHERRVASRGRLSLG